MLLLPLPLQLHHPSSQALSPVVSSQKTLLGKGLVMQLGISGLHVECVVCAQRNWPKQKRSSQTVQYSPTLVQAAVTA